MNMRERNLQKGEQTDMFGNILNKVYKLHYRLQDLCYMSPSKDSNQHISIALFLLQWLQVTYIPAVDKTILSIVNKINEPWLLTIQTDQSSDKWPTPQGRTDSGFSIATEQALDLLAPWLSSVQTLNLQPVKKFFMVSK